MDCEKSYDFIEPPLMFPSNPIEQAGPNGLYFDWVGLCKDGTLTFGRESGDKSEIILSREIYRDESGELVYYKDCDFETYWIQAGKFLDKIFHKSPRLYGQILDALSRHGFPYPDGIDYAQWWKDVMTFYGLDGLEEL